jgi:hypothetical protein
MGESILGVEQGEGGDRERGERVESGERGRAGKAWTESESNAMGRGEEMSLDGRWERVGLRGRRVGA